jgi:hypothetical protein
MKRSLGRAVVLAALAVAAFTIGDLNAGAQKEDKKKSLTIKQIMAKAHKKGGALVDITAELRNKEVKWDEITSKSKDLLLIAGDLAMNSPPKGDKESWEKLCKEYTDKVQELQKAAEAKNLADAKKACAALNASCKSCHPAHKGK